MKKGSLFFILFLLGSQFSLAQTEEEFFIDSLSINGSVSLMGRWQTGNLNQISLMPNGRISLSNNSFYLELNSAYHFLKVDGFKAKNDLWTYGLFQYQPNNRIFPSLHTIMGFAKSYEIDHSIVMGAGGGVNIYKQSPDNFLQVHLYGALFNFQYKEEEPHKAIAIGSQIRARIPISRQINFRWELSGFYSTQDRTFWGGGNLLQLNFIILKNLMLNINHQTNYNNQTTPNIENTNTEMLFGIQYQFINN